MKISLAQQAPINGGREKYLKGKHDFIVYTLRKALVKSYLGKTVNISIDRTIGSVYPKHDDIVYPILPRDIHYTVVVNSVDIGKELRRFDNIDVYIAGGKMRQSGSLVDSLANEFVSRLHFDLCFITGAGLTVEFGLSNGTDETATFQRTVIKNSRNRCLVIPSSKIGVDSFIKVCDIDAVDSIITDWDCVEDQITAIEERGVEFTVVEEPK